MNDSLCSSPAPGGPAPTCPPGQWPRRGDALREQEWEMAQKLLAAARRLLSRLQLQPGLAPSVTDLARLLDLASKLGRLATGLETGKTAVTGPAGGPISVEVEVALRKIYGEPLPAEVIECEVVKDSSSQ